MKRLHVIISDEGHANLTAYQRRHDFKNLDTAVDEACKRLPKEKMIPVTVGGV